MIGTIKGRCIATGKLLPTLAVGAAGGGIAYAFDIPLPWLLGALIATTVLSLGGVRLRAPTTSRKAVLVVIGVMLGAAFTPDMTGDVALWGTSLVLMLLATAVMITYMERACARAMLPLLEDGQMTVGVKFEIAHFNPTPVGADFVTFCRYLHREKALYWFEVWCEDGAGLVGKGRHARAVVHRAEIEATAGQRRST